MSPRLSAATIRILAEYADPVALAEMRVVTGVPGRWLPSLLGTGAVTIGRRVCFARGRYDALSPKGLALIAHETGHIEQVRSMGLAWFFARYFWGAVRSGFRHGRHPMEIELIERQRQVREALEGR